MNWVDFINEKELIDSLLSNIETYINEDIDLHGEALVLLSGGSTPLTLYKRFKELAVKWEKVTIGLVDERYISKAAVNSNYFNIKKALGESIISKAYMKSLVEQLDNQQENLLLVRKINNDLFGQKSIVILGMGTDGHTASLFPNSHSIKRGIESKIPELIASNSPTEPVNRITHNRASILLTKHLILYIKGAEKKKVFEESSKIKAPISYFIEQQHPILNIYWTR
tara:strand:+ start:172 stop:849 length:678 start_codon:yes stop_codon:yes gene_type:complete